MRDWLLALLRAPRWLLWQPLMPARRRAAGYSRDAARDAGPPRMSRHRAARTVASLFHATAMPRGWALAMMLDVGAPIFYRSI